MYMYLGKYLACSVVFLDCVDGLQNRRLSTALACWGSNPVCINGYCIWKKANISLHLRYEQSCKKYTSSVKKDDPRRRSVPVYCAPSDGMDLVSIGSEFIGVIRNDCGYGQKNSRSSIWSPQSSAKVKILAWPLGHFCSSVSLACRRFWPSTEFSQQWNTPWNLSVTVARVCVLHCG